LTVVFNKAIGIVLSLTVVPRLDFIHHEKGLEKGSVVLVPGISEFRPWVAHGYLWRFALHFYSALIVIVIKGIGNFLSLLISIHVVPLLDFIHHQKGLEKDDSLVISSGLQIIARGWHTDIFCNLHRIPIWHGQSL
jgi:hypothetical protein